MSKSNILIGAMALCLIGLMTWLYFSEEKSVRAARAKQVEQGSQGSDRMVLESEQMINDYHFTFWRDTTSTSLIVCIFHSGHFACVKE